MKNSRLSRRAELRLEKKLARMHQEEAYISKILDTAKVALASTPGVFLAGELIIDGLERIGYFGDTQKATSATSSPPIKNPAVQAAGKSTNNVLSLISSALPPGIGDIFAAVSSGTANLINPDVGKVAGPLTQSLNPSLQPGQSLTAQYLREGLFAICMVQALGGGNGIATLGTSLLSAVK